MDENRTRDDSLSNDGFESLYEGALEIKSERKKLKALYIALCCGRLGLEAIEVQHLREAWINWERGEIKVPEHDPCACRRCCILAEREWLRSEFNRLQGMGVYPDCKSFGDADVSELFEKSNPENLAEIIYEYRFSSTSRTIPFGWSQRITGVLINFYDQIGSHLRMSQEDINSLLREAASNASEIEGEHINTNVLRNTSKEFFRSAGFPPKMYRDVLGLKHLSQAEKQVQSRSQNAALSAYEILAQRDPQNEVNIDRSEYSVDEVGVKRTPPMGSNKPKKDFPIACDPEMKPLDPFDPTNYDESKRKARARRQRDKTYPILHPRKEDFPDSRQHFPNEIQYDWSRHSIPDHQEINLTDKQDLPRIDSPTIVDYIKPHDTSDFNLEDHLASTVDDWD